MEYFDNPNWIEEKYGQTFCNSGGAPGSDTVFEEECIKKGIPVIAWSFPAHNIKSPNKKNLTKEELDEGWEHVIIANKTLKRNIYNLSPYVRNLLSRNWFQVKNSDAVFAIGEFDNGPNKNNFTTVKGGTGWAIEEAINNNIPVYFFDQIKGLWFNDGIIRDVETGIEWTRFMTNKDSELKPKLTPRFAGIGTREINEVGIMAIKKLFL